MLIAAILFGIMALLVKILTGYLPAEEIVFVRFFVGFTSILLLAFLRVIRLKFNNRPVLAVRGIIGGIAILFYFKAIALIPLSDAVVISFTYPIFGTFFASLFLKEKMNAASVAALFVSFFGIYLISNPAFKQINIGYFYGLLSAMLAGGAVVSIRQLRKTDDSWSISLALMTGGTIFGGISSINNLIAPSFNLVILLITMAIIATIAQLLLTYSYKFCNVLEGSTISMSTVLVAVVLAIVFLGERITLPFVIGTTLILGSALYLLYSHPGEITK